MAAEYRSRAPGTRSIEGHIQRPSYPAGHVTYRPAAVTLGLVSRLVGGAGVVGAVYYQPIALGGVATVILLLIGGVVFPAVWSRNSARRRAAATVLRLLLTALAGPWIATAATRRPHARTTEVSHDRE